MNTQEIRPKNHLCSPYPLYFSIFLLGFLNYLTFQICMGQDYENNRNLEIFLHN